MEINAAPYKGKWTYNPKQSLEYKVDNSEYKVLTTDINHFEAMENFNYLKLDRDSHKFKRAYNKKMLGEESFTTGTSFQGGSVKDLYETQNTSGYRKYEKEHKSNFVKDYKFTPQLSRKRCFNEHDGDWDMDRRWDIAPYEGVTKKPVQNPFIKLNVHCSFNSGVGSKEIDEYGFFIASICNFLEANSYAIEINLITITRRPNRVVDYHVINNRIKERNEYLSIQRILKVFRSNYYRRVKFAHTIMGADLREAEVDSGLGSPFNYPSDVKVTKGQIDIFSSSKSALDKTLITKIKKELGI